jgi:hypothetical protein
MTQTAQTILEAFFAFRSRQVQRATWNKTLRQMTHLPDHLIDDVDPHAKANVERNLTRPSFNNSDGIHKIYSLD